MTPTVTARGLPSHVAECMGESGFSMGEAGAEAKTSAEFDVGAHDNRERDLLPLPTGMLDASVVRGGLSRCVRRRRARALHVNEWAEAAVETLNEMQGGPQQYRQANIHASAGQRAFVSRLRLAVAEIGPPPSDVTEEGALRALLSKQGYAGESATLDPST